MALILSTIKAYLPLKIFKVSIGLSSDIVNENNDSDNKYPMNKDKGLGFKCVRFIQFLVV